MISGSNTAASVSQKSGNLIHFILLELEFFMGDLALNWSSFHVQSTAAARNPPPPPIQVSLFLKQTLSAVVQLRLQGKISNMFLAW